MSKIKLILVEARPLFRTALQSMLHTTHDIEVIASFAQLADLKPKYGLLSGHVALISLPQYDAKIQLPDIKYLAARYPKCKILVYAQFRDESFLIESIKAGAKGYLSKESGRQDLLEAIYSLRSGHEYYDQSVTAFLLDNYLNHPSAQFSLSKNGWRGLSRRELEVIRLFGRGLTNQEIAEKLFISIRTVESHKNNVMRKVNLRTTVDLVKFAIRNNIIQLHD